MSGKERYMDKLLFGLSIMEIGLLVVFVGLIILILRINRLSKLTEANGRTWLESKGHTAPAEAEAPVAEGISNEVLAVITAAVAAVWNDHKGLVIRHVKRIHNAPAWNRAGREEQTYSRF